MANVFELWINWKWDKCCPMITWLRNKIFLRDNFKYGVAAGNVKNAAG